MSLEQLLHFLQISFVQSLKRHRFEVTTVLEGSVFVQNIGYPARHAGGKISPRCPDNDHPTSGHILAAMIAYTFNHGTNTTIAHTESLASHTANIRLAIGSAVKGHIANDNIVLWRKSRTFRRIQNHLAAGKTFAKIVVSVTLQFEGHASWDKCPKALTRGSFKVEMNGVFRQTLRSKPSGNFTAKNRPDHAIGIADVQRRFDFLP